MHVPNTQGTVTFGNRGDVRVCTEGTILACIIIIHVATLQLFHLLSLSTQLLSPVLYLYVLLLVCDLLSVIAYKFNVEG